MSLLTHAQLHTAAAQVKDIDLLNQALQADSENLDLMYQLIAMDALNNHITDVLDQLLVMLKLDASYKNKLPAKTMVLLFKSLDDNSDLVKKYRVKMMDALSEISSIT